VWKRKVRKSVKTIQVYKKYNGEMCENVYVLRKEWNKNKRVMVGDKMKWHIVENGKWRRVPV